MIKAYVCSFFKILCMPDKAEVIPFYTKKNKVTKGIKNAGYNGIKQE